MKKILMAQTSLRLQIIAIAIYALAIIFLVIAAGLFGDTHRRFNEQATTRLDVCILFFKASDLIFTSKSVSLLSIVGEVLAALGLVFLVILSIVKLVGKLIGNKIVLIVEIFILLFSGIFALIVAIILSSGWGVARDTINDANRFVDSTGFDCNTDYLKQFTASFVFSLFAVVAIVGSFIITIIIAVLGP